MMKRTNRPASQCLPAAGRSIPAAILAAFLLSACGLTPAGDVIRETVAAKGRVVGGQMLENAEWVMCRAAPVGAVKDRYGKPGLAEHYSALCEGSSAEILTGNEAR